jgi:hypothetical protein
MSVKIELKLRPFPIPDGVVIDRPPGLRQDGFIPAPVLKLGELDEETLEQLCEQFREAVYKKAGKESPKLKVERAQALAAKEKAVVEAAIVWAMCPDSGSYKDGPAIEDTCELLGDVVKDLIDYDDVRWEWTVDEMFNVVGNQFREEYGYKNEQDGN